MLVETAVAVGVALADSLNPATIGQAVILATGERPRKALVAFWSGAFGFYVLLAAGLTLGPGRLIAEFVRNPPPALRLGELTLGAAAIIAGVFVWRRRHRLHPGRRLVAGDPRTALRLGVLVTVADLPNAFPLYALTAYVAGSGLSDLRQLAVLLVYSFVYLLPVLGVLLVSVFLRDRAEAFLGRARTFVERNTATVAAVVLVVGGTALTAHASVNLYLWSKRDEVPRRWWERPAGERNRPVSLAVSGLRATIRWEGCRLETDRGTRSDRRLKPPPDKTGKPRDRRGFSELAAQGSGLPADIRAAPSAR